MQADKEVKKTYQTPELVEYGSIEDITAGTVFGAADAGENSNPG